ncbi:hypothetical protein [Sideroxydans sp. CL21]|jgi:hypothetical protein|nr:hypothetical protein [Sideroxydans sp. CL21]
MQQFRVTAKTKSLHKIFRSALSIALGLSKFRSMAFLGAALVPAPVFACACGCGIFDVGLPGLPVSGMNDQVSLQYAYMNQNQNHSGSSNAAGALNPDQQIKTEYYNLYGQHMFNRDWGIMAMVPFWQRSFTTDTNGTPGVTDAAAGVTPGIENANVRRLSDIRVMGMYTGFDADMSSGLTFGLKLPTGTTTASPLLDRDTEPGTGTTDLLLGGYKMGYIGKEFGWFSQGTYRHALNTYQSYKPGDSLNVTAGVTYNGLTGTTKVIPMLQVNAQWRGSDQGGGDAIYGNVNSGYRNLYIAPGVMVNLTRHLQANASIYIPAYRFSNGNQLVPQWLGNAGITYMF